MAQASFYKPIYLSYYGGLTSSFDQSDAFPRSSKQDGIEAPYKLGELFFTSSHHSMIQTFFKKEFRNSTSKKCGSSALNSAPANPLKVAWFSAVESATFHNSVAGFSFGSSEFRRRACNFIWELHKSGQQVIAQYLNQLEGGASCDAMLRKLRCKVWERWSFLAKRAMLNLKGDQLAKLEEFESVYSQEFDIS